jgi:hypothetical protein
MAIGIGSSWNEDYESEDISVFSHWLESEEEIYDGPLIGGNMQEDCHEVGKTFTPYQYLRSS